MAKPKKNSKHKGAQKYCGPLPIFDARANLIIPVTVADITKAVALDPNHCAIAEACRRMFGSTRVMIFRGGICYVDLIHPEVEPVGEGVDDRHAMMRFKADLRSRRLIAEFDRTGVVRTCTITLNPPPRSYSIHAPDVIARKRDNSRRARERRKARMAASPAAASPDKVKRFRPGAKPMTSGGAEPQTVVHLRPSSPGRLSDQPRYDWVPPEGVKL